ncbi:uncharacterized protein LOC131852744 [Achroia grisella]|uniref:uncharacterized protein LOC131852744 n=1 Tax=Achroia grisella TaxID=688607 RepID=UPI0027D27DC8|nr:uncharacterized protein LOC131852744 [Achroia grisella]
MAVRPLSLELIEKARLELNEDPKRLEDGIMHLKEWIAKQPHLRARTDDQWLAAFLRGCKHSLELAKEKIDIYYSLRSTAPDLFSLKHTDSKFMELLKTGVILVLPKVLKTTDPRVIIVRASEYDPNKYFVTELLALSLVIQQILYLEDDTLVVSGISHILDLEGACMNHFIQITPTTLKKLMVIGQDASPARLKSAHYLSTPPGFETVFSIGKKIMSEKYKSRLHVHNKNFDDLYKHVPKEILPVEYGGSGGTAQEIIDYWIKKIEAYSGWLEDDRQYGTDESKRAGKPKTAEDVFGLDEIKMIRELSPELAKIAKDELSEEPKRINDDLQHLKDWISKQPHLKARIDDQWLIGFLRGSKFSLERVKKKLDLYYTLRTTSPDITLRIKPSEQKFIDFLRVGTCVVLPKVKNGLYPRVILIRAGAYDPEKNNVADIMCVLYYLVQIVLMEDDAATVIGTKIMVDYEGVTMTHFAQASPSLLKKMVAVCQDSMPLRLKGSHHIKVPSGIDLIFSLISTFLNEKAKERLNIHKNQDDLLRVIPKEIIPAEYGGDGGTVSEIIEYWVNKVNEYKPWMKQEENFGTDESKRLEKLANYDEFSNQGSFRKLDID